MESFRGTGDEETEEIKETKQEIGKGRLRSAFRRLLLLAINKNRQ